MDDRPNILLIMTDQQRYDSLSCYGSQAVQTPNIDRLAAEGVLFEHCYVNNPICTPSRASMFTGRPLPGHGVYRLHDIFPPDQALFTKHLQERGYTTALFGKLHVSGRSFELDNRHPNDGFDIYEESKAPYNLAGSLNGYARWLRREHPEFAARLEEAGRKIGNMPEEVHLTRWISESTARFIEDQDGSRPFFCFMSIFDPHDPYSDFPLGMRELVDEQRLPEPNVVEGESHGKPEAITREHEHSYLGSFHDYSPEDIRRMRFGYFASIAFMDQEVGKVLAALERKGILDDTLVIFVSDHGDMLGDHELLAKGAFFYDPCTRVPCIVRLPRQVKAGLRCAELVQPSDIAATVLSRAGFESEELGGLMPDSRDLVSLAAGRTPGRDHAVCLYRATSICDRKLYWDPPINATMFRDRRYKLNVYHGPVDDGAGFQGELYDMENDPLERKDLWSDPEHADTRSRLLARTMDWIVETDRKYHGSRGGEAFPPQSQWSLNNPL